MEFTTNKNCHYCGADIFWAEYNTNTNGSNYNLDRKDNAIGYSKENCVACCGRCNESKSNHFTYEQFVQIGDLIRSWR